ncbi:hypothetical protein GH714_026417 [Hevea brasiliensis]|uniref:Hexosyltransferase n=1 Tax=Hevea brasiliensis TaxID=3981 RepID=A0A6A6M220_HEVBR|nr:hypothetical protein GH714_026417 [Hevea brasiliensis]
MASLVAVQQQTQPSLSILLPLCLTSMAPDFTLNSRFVYDMLLKNLLAAKELLFAIGVVSKYCKRKVWQTRGALQVTASSSKNILIMGGTRFIGVFLSRLLVKEGHQVTLFTRGKAPITQQLPGESDQDFADFSSKILHLKGDRKDFDFVKSSLSAKGFDVVYDINGREADEVAPILDALPKLEQYIYCSSAGVYLKTDLLPHSEDLAAAFVQVLGNEKATKQVFNISGEKYVTFDGLARACAKHFFASVDKAKHVLGWKPEFDLVKGLADSYNLDFGRGTYRKEADFSTDDLILGWVGKGLRKVNSKYPLVVAILPDVPEEHRKILFVEYSKMIYLDGDIQVFENIDHLFDVQDGYFYGVMDCFCEQTWSHSLQHKIGYCQQCPDRVQWPTEMGPKPPLYFNAGMFVFEPNLSTYHDLLSTVKVTTPTLFAEQDFLNMFFKDIFRPLPPIYNLVLALLWRHPENIELDKLKVVHYCAAGSKPWRYTGKEKNMDREDIKMLIKKWWDIYNDESLDYKTLWLLLLDALRSFNQQDYDSMIKYERVTPKAQGGCDACFNTPPIPANPLADRNRQIRILIAMAIVTGHELVTL